MKYDLFNIPFLDGYKTLIGGWGLTLIGTSLVISKVSALVLLVGQCFTGDATFSDCVDQLPAMIVGLLSGFSGLSVLGIGHKAQWIIDLLDKKNA